MRPTYMSLIETESEKQKSNSQHRGVGRKLLSIAEDISRKNGFNKVAIISGVGVRNYYRKFGYELEGAFMVKTLDIYNPIKYLEYQMKIKLEIFAVICSFHLFTIFITINHNLINDEQFHLLCEQNDLISIFNLPIIMLLLFF